MNGTSVFQLLGKLAIDGVDETKKALDDVAKGGEDAKNKLNVSFQDIGNKAGELGRSMAKGLSIGVTAITASYEATKEFRMDLGRLEAGYEGVGLSGDTANKVFKDFYGVLGETDTAVEASNLLKELAQDEQGLAEWTTIATGVYARFPDSIPIEALIESANETSKVGQVTGNLADALNWAGVSEEKFNEKLAKCNTEAEREKLIRETLNGLYSDSATQYQTNNQGLIENNKAQADLNMQMADTMAKIEPLITQGKIFIAEVLLKLQPLITWGIENINILAPLVLGFMTTLFALNIASKVQKFIPIVKTLFTVLKANPIGLIITAITLLVGAFIYLWNNCEGFREFWIELGKKIKETWNKAVDGVKDGIENVKKFFGDMKDNISSKINSIKTNVSNTFNKIQTSMSKPVEKARDTIKGIVDKIKGFFDFEFKTPKLKTPKFSVSPSGWKVGDLLEGVIPKLSVKWNAEGAIFDKPTIFNTRYGLQGVGEAGAEAVAPISKLMDYTRIAVEGSNAGLENKLDRVVTLLANYLPTLQNLQIILDTGEVVGALTNPLDKSLGELADRKAKGY